MSLRPGPERLQVELEAATIAMNARDQLHRAACMIGDEEQIEAAYQASMEASAAVLRARQKLTGWKPHRFSV